MPASCQWLMHRVAVLSGGRLKNMPWEKILQSSGKNQRDDLKTRGQEMRDWGRCLVRARGTSPRHNRSKYINKGLICDVFWDL